MKKTFNMHPIFEKHDERYGDKADGGDRYKRSVRVIQDMLDFCREHANPICNHIRQESAQAPFTPLAVQGDSGLAFILTRIQELVQELPGVEINLGTTQNVHAPFGWNFHVRVMNMEDEIEEDFHMHGETLWVVVIRGLLALLEMREQIRPKLTS